MSCDETRRPTPDAEASKIGSGQSAEQRKWLDGKKHRVLQR